MKYLFIIASFLIASPAFGAMSTVPNSPATYPQTIRVVNASLTDGGHWFVGFDSEGLPEGSMLTPANAFNPDGDPISPASAGTFTIIQCTSTVGGLCPYSFDSLDQARGNAGYEDEISFTWNELIGGGSAAGVLIGGLFEFGLKMLEILAAVMGVGVGFLVFYVGWRKVKMSEHPDGSVMSRSQRNSRYEDFYERKLKKGL